jgi:hypothetical protein
MRRNKTEMFPLYLPGVYLSKYSDLLQINPFNPGVMGEIIIFKVIKVRKPCCFLFFKKWSEYE